MEEISQRKFFASIHNKNILQISLVWIEIESYLCIIAKKKIKNSLFT